MKDRRVDAYIEKAPEFAQPVLKHLRSLVHSGCPDVIETMKWSAPFFEHKGVLCNMAAFKAHCSFGFWKREVIQKELPNRNEAMGDFGRITSLQDLPSDREMLAIIKEAVRLNEEGIKAPKPPRSKESKELEIPKAVLNALKKNAKAAKTFENFSYSHRKEYVQWINDAKTEETRERRIAQMLEWLKEGKSRNWKYARC